LILLELFNHFLKQNIYKTMTIIINLCNYMVYIINIFFVLHYLLKIVLNFC